MIPETLPGLLFGFIVFAVTALVLSVTVVLIAGVLDKTGLVEPPQGTLVIREEDKPQECD